MTGVDITLTNTQIRNRGNELGDLIITKMIPYNMLSVQNLCVLGLTLNSDDWVKASTIEASKEMRCEIDDLRDELRIELAKAKKYMLKKYPVRTRLVLLKLILKNPFRSAFGLIILSYRKLKQLIKR